MGRIVPGVNFMRWILVLALLCGSAARAENFVVTTAIDDTDTIPGNGQCRTVETVCALRAAIQEANAFPGPDTITLPAGSFEITTVQSNPLGLAGEDAAASGDLDVTSEITITGAGAALTVIEAGGDGTRADRVFHVLGAGDLSLRQLAVRDGQAIASAATALGGGIYNQGGVLDLADCVVADNDANAGGGVFNAGTLLIDRCTFSGNDAQNVAFTNAQGGALMSSGGAVEVQITGSTLSGNSADLSGHAIFASGGTLSVENSTLSANLGGATTLVIENSDVVLTNVTLVGNAGVGLSAFSSGGNTLDVENTIVAGNGGGDCSIAGSSPIISVTSSLSSDESCGFGLENLDPQLGPLADNGGPTRTHLPLPGSPAIDAGAASPVCPDFDQRDEARPEDGDGDSTADCDIGAVEVPEPGALACGALALGLAAGLARRRA
jgi:CSLREA domain-containing protein